VFEVLLFPLELIRVLLNVPRVQANEWVLNVFQILRQVMLGVDVSQDVVGYSFCGGILGSIVEANGLGSKACNDVFFVFLNVDVFSLQEVFEKG
jgi:hypothetical protein